VESTGEIAMTLEDAFAMTRPDIVGSRRVFGPLGDVWSEATRDSDGTTTFTLTTRPGVMLLQPLEISDREPPGVTEWLTQEQYSARRRAE
jgi:hypothetical protein